MWWSKYGFLNMNVLVTYSSGYGSTKEVAEKIAAIFDEKGGVNVTVDSVDDINDIDSFDAVVVGSSVRADRPLANVRDFFARHNEELKTKPVALFAVCLAANNPEGRDKVKREYLSQITQKYPKLKLIGKEAFGGKIDFDKLNDVMRQLMKRVLEKTGIESEGTVDTRDWDFIEAWAVEIYGRLDS